VHVRHPGGERRDGLGHLDRELAGRGEDQRLRSADARVEAGEQRQRECGGLAGAGLRQAEDVAAVEQQRNGLGLDRGGRGEALVDQRAEHAVVEAQRGEAVRGLGGLIGGLVGGLDGGSLVVGGSLVGTVDLVVGGLVVLVVADTVREERVERQVGVGQDGSVGHRSLSRWGTADWIELSADPNHARSHPRPTARHLRRRVYARRS